MPTTASILTRGRILLYGNTCTIKRSGGDVTGYTTPVTEHSNLACSNVYEISNEEIERAGLASISRPCRLFVKLPTTGSIKDQDWVTVNSKDYVIIKAVLWPQHDPTHYDLIMDYQR